MDIVQRLVEEWTERACGLTIDVVGDSQLSAEVQWVIALPLTRTDPVSRVNAINQLRDELEQTGLQRVPEAHFDPAAQLPNKTEVQSTCPYRPDSCLGEHLIATGHGLICDVTQPRPTKFDEDRRKSSPM